MGQAVAMDYAPGPRGLDEVLYAVTDGIGRVRLNRPRALNALTGAMIDDLSVTLDGWRDDAAVERVILDGAGERGLCAGGDVKEIRQLALVDPVAAADVWAREYALDALIATFPKPVEARMNGIVMGGGLGLAGYAADRIVFADTRIAMPETVIGFFPDAGITHLLARAPGELGTYLALTGATIGPAEAVLVGLADRYAAPESRAAGRSATEQPAAGTPDAGSFPAEAPDVEPGLERDRRWIDECFLGNDAAVIVARLRDHAEPRARECAADLAARSPFAVAVALERVRRAASEPTVVESLAVDTALASAFMHRSDFAEGVRARVVDKDNTPHWRHTSLTEVSRGEVLDAFAAAPTAS